MDDKSVALDAVIKEAVDLVYVFIDKDLKSRIALLSLLNSFVICIAKNIEFERESHYNLTYKFNA